MRCGSSAAACSTGASSSVERCVAVAWFRASAHASALGRWSLRCGTISQVTSRPAAAQHLCDLARLRGAPRPDRPGVRAAAGRRGTRPRRTNVGRAPQPRVPARLRRVALRLPHDAAHRVRDGAAASWRPQRHRSLLRGRLLVAGHLQQWLHRTDTLGFEVRNDVAYGGMRWITIGPRRPTRHVDFRASRSSLSSTRHTGSM